MANPNYTTEDVTAIKNNRVVRLNMYWACVDGDPTRAAYYRESAQGNTHQELASRIKQSVENRTGWNVEMVFIPVAYCPNTLNQF